MCTVYFEKKSNKGIISIDSSLCFALDMICYFSTLSYKINSENGINVTLKKYSERIFKPLCRKYLNYKLCIE